MRVTIQKKTDQLNFEDFLGGVTRTVTIAGVKKGSKEQQYDIEIEGDQRVWRPAVTVLKILVEAWTDDATTWVGRRATLYGDPTVTFGRDKVGGIRISHLSHIEKTLTLSLTETRGKKSRHTVEPLIESAPTALPEPTAEQVAACTDLGELQRMWQISGAERQAQIETRAAEVKAASNPANEGPTS